MGEGSLSQHAEDFEVLVEELMKDKPSASLIRQLSLKLGITYNSDLVTQMSTVLQEAHRFYGNPLNKNSEMEN